jgi:DNA polymerase III delta subunit
MILLLRGVDDMAIRRRLREIKDAADGGSGMIATNLVQLEGRDVRAEDILAHAMTPPFLAPKRLIIVDAFLDRWQPRGDQRQPRSIEPFAPLFAAIQGAFPPTTDLVLRGGEVGDRNSMLKRLKELPGVADEVHAELKGEPLLRYIREEAAARGVRFRNGPFRKQDPLDDELRKIGDPAALLAATIHVEAGENEWRSDTIGLTNELDKLALYSMGREVTVDDVYELCTGARHAGNFALADAIMDGNLRRALDTLRLLHDDGVEPQLIIGGLAARYRQLAGTAELVDEGAPTEEIAKAMGRPGEFPRIRDDAIRRARRIRPAGVRASLATIVDLDRQTKMGEIDHELALELMVIRLARIGAGR